MFSFVTESIVTYIMTFSMAITVAELLIKKDVFFSLLLNVFDVCYVGEKIKTIFPFEMNLIKNFLFIPS